MKNKTKKYRGGKCDIIGCRNIKNDNLKQLCEELGGITNLINPFIDKNNLSYNNERKYTDDELASMNAEYNSIIQNNCTNPSNANPSNANPSNANPSNANPSNANQSNSNQSNSNVNQSNANNICNTNNPIISINDNTKYDTLNDTLDKWNSCRPDKKDPIKIHYNNENDKQLTELIKKYNNNNKFKFVYIKKGGTRRKNKRKTNKKRIYPRKK